MNSDLTLMDWFVAIAPLAILVAVFWFFIQRALKFWQSFTDLQRRQTEALERVAASLEKRG
jgi:hypothetical protein